ncbi:MAG TPA: zinc-dependent metalloprotease [Acidimicrobiales bacterium]|nr:zinc-dependent metalloprotease [Acidimicrobiales bacterium]
MSWPTPSEGGNPFEQLFSQLGRMFASSGPVNWDLARQFAQWAATEGADPGNVDPLERIRLEELIKVADLHVADATGLGTSTTGRVVTVRAVTRGEWAVQTLDAWKPLLTGLAGSLNPGPPAEGSAHTEPGGAPNMLGPLLPGLQAAFLGLQSGSMVGSMAQRVFGQYDLPIPRPPGDEILIVAGNVTEFAGDWSLPVDDVRLWVCLSEVTHHAVLGRQHVRARVDDLLGRYVAGFDPSASSLEERLADVDPMEPESLERVLGDPNALLGEIQSEEQRRLLPEITALLCVIEGYVDHVVDVVGSRLIGAHGPLTEALRRRRVERGQGERMVERLLGVELRQEQYDRGTAFVRGVIERAGADALNRLWSETDNLPTTAEVEAPGLWLERIDLPR